MRVITRVSAILSSIIEPGRDISKAIETFQHRQKRQKGPSGYLSENELGFFP